MAFTADFDSSPFSLANFVVAINATNFQND